MTPLWLVPAMPLAAAAFIAVWRTDARRAPNVFGSIACLASATSIVLMLWRVPSAAVAPSAARLTSIVLGGRSLELGLRADPLAALMAILVASIAAVVIAYSVAYMRDDPAPRRFFAVMSLFTAAMLTLVLADGYLLLYVGWEIVGFCSYLLITHDWRDPAANGAAFKAFLVTRIGDLGLLLGIGIMLLAVGDLRYEVVAGAVRSGSFAGLSLTIAAFLLLAGAFGKSAQFPLHVWLPDAMAGPTPVSALIHSATMVAAGVYLLARSTAIIQAVPEASTALTVVGGITALGASFAALAQTDVKRLLAYSTMSQLAEMMLALGTALTGAAIFHLVTHATFKALLFLAAGIATRAAHSNQLDRLRPPAGASVAFLAGALSLSGVPPFGGSWSKEMLGSHGPAIVNAIYLLLGALSSLYIARAWFLGFARSAVHRETSDVDRHESVLLMWPTYALVPATALVGLLAMPLQSSWFAAAPLAPFEWTSISVMRLMLVALGWGAAAMLYGRRGLARTTAAERWRGMRELARGGFGTVWLASVMAHGTRRVAAGLASIDTRAFEHVSSHIAVRMRGLAGAAQQLDHVVFDSVSNRAAGAILAGARGSDAADRRVLDRGIERGATQLGNAGARLRILQTGRIYHYLAALFAWVALAAAIVALVRM